MRGSNTSIDSQTRFCATKACPNDCIGAWGHWGALCTSTCGGGSRARSFVLSAPAEYGGALCQAADGDTETDICNTQVCALSPAAIGSMGGAGAVVVAIVVVVVCVMKKKRKVRSTARKPETGSLPPALSAFVSLDSDPDIQALAAKPEMAGAYYSLLSHDRGRVLRYLRTALPILAEKMQTRIFARCHDEGIAAQCRDVSREADSEFHGIYDEVYKRVRRDAAGIALYRATVRAVQLPGAGATQAAHDAVELLQHAAQTKPLFDNLMRSLLDGINGAELDVPAGLKKPTRIVEKALLNAESPGSVADIFDVVRCMCLCKDMSVVATVIACLSGCDDISMVRIKDRFEGGPTSGGWRDFMACFYINDDSAQHVCEVQVVLTDMLTARKGLPGHAVYTKGRNAIELSQMLMAGRRLWGWTKDDAQRAGFNAEAMVAAGFAIEEPRSV